MARANAHSTTKLSTMFRDPYLRAVFAAAEDDGAAELPTMIDNPKTLDGGAAELVPTTGRRVLVEA